MSLNLYMVPIRPKNGADLPDALKYILRENEDWYSERGCVDHVATDDDIPYLRGLRDAKVDGARELIEAIEQYGAVRVYTA